MANEQLKIYLNFSAIWISNFYRLGKSSLYRFSAIICRALILIRWNPDAKICYSKENNKPTDPNLQLFHLMKVINLNNVLPHIKRNHSCFCSWKNTFLWWIQDSFLSKVVLENTLPCLKVCSPVLVCTQAVHATSQVT